MEEENVKTLPENSTPVSVEKTDYRGWSAVCLCNELVTLVAVPDIGGRIMAYDLCSYPFLFVDPELAGALFTSDENLGDGSLAAWKNYGGDKTWPAPQGWEDENQWHGPPDPILDTGTYSLLEMETDGHRGQVVMASPPDSRTGIQITRKASLHLGSTRVTLELTFKNISERSIRWSIWDVVQLRSERILPDGSRSYEPNCWVSAPINPNSRFERGYNVMFGDEDNPQWDVDDDEGLFIARYQWEIGKVGVDSPGNWIAFSNGAEGYAFTESYQYFPDAEYPDDGVSVECWTVGRGVVANLDYEKSGIYLMETEVLSPLYSFQPGESRKFTIEWGVCACPGPVLDVTSAGCVGKRFTVTEAGSFQHLMGEFGVFEPGELILLWEDGQDRLISEDSLGRVTPLEAVRLDMQAALPRGAKKIILQVIADVDGLTRELTSLEL